MRKIAIKGKEWGFHVGSKRTKITGPKGNFIVENAAITVGSITPGKMTSFILKEYHQ